MEKEQKDHIIKNIVKLVANTRNETDWCLQLLATQFISISDEERIKKTAENTDFRIKNYYFECLKSPKYDLLIQSLRNSNNVNAAKILEEFDLSFSSTSNKKDKLLWFGLHLPTRHYKGRKKELDTIHNYWVESCQSDLLTFVGISGLGGIGKSELAKKYAYIFYTVVQGHCIWINAENMLTYLDSLRKLSNKIGISLLDSHGEEKKLNALTSDVFQLLSKEKCLVVFDNLENYQEYFLDGFMAYAKEIPPMETKPFVILTSRYKLVTKTFGYYAKPLPLSVLTDSSAVSFFKDALDITEEEFHVFTDLKNLCLCLGNLPLAMQQAASYINETKQNSDVAQEIKNYLQIFQNESTKLLQHAVPGHQNSESLSKSIYLTWEITLKKIKDLPEIGSLVEPAINIISFFESENISVEFIKSILRLYISEHNITKIKYYDGSINVFEMLANYSMCQLIKFDNDVFLSVHRLVQSVNLIQLSKKQEWTTTLNILLEIVSDNFLTTVTIRDVSHIVRLIKYAEENINTVSQHQKFYSLLNHVRSIQIQKGFYQENKIFQKYAVQLCKKIFGDEAPQTLAMMSKYGDTLSGCGELNNAESLLRPVYEKQKDFEALLTSEKEIGTDVIYTKSVIANLRMKQGNYDEAHKMHLEVLETEQQVLGIDHPNTLITKSNIASIHKSKGNYDEALKMHLEVLEARHRMLGIDHPHTLTTKSYIASIHDSKGNYDEALKMHLEVLEIQQQVLGINHPNTLTTKSYIASIHDSKGNYDEALKMHLEVLEIRQQVLGINHPNTLITKSYISSIHKSKGNYDKALKMHLEVLETEQQVLGIDHPNTLITKSNIASIHKSKGNYDEALKMHLEVLEIQQQVLGIDHPNTLITKSNIASIHKSKGNYDEALKMHLEVLEARHRMLGIDHPHTLTTKSYIASIHDSKGNYDVGLKMHLEVLETEKQVLGINHPNTLITKSYISSIHKSKGNYDKALKMHLEVLETEQQVLGINHPNTLITKSNIASIHKSKGNYDEALKMHLEVLEIRQQVLGIDHPNTLITKSNIASIHKSKGNYDEALKMHLEVLEIQQQVLGIDHPNTLITKSNIASIHKSKGNYDEALKMHLEVLEARHRMLGIDHPHTLTTKSYIASIHDSKGNYDEALKMHLEVLEIQQQVLGINHPNTLSTKSYIALRNERKKKKCYIL